MNNRAKFSQRQVEALKWVAGHPHYPLATYLNFGAFAYLLQNGFIANRPGDLRTVAHITPKGRAKLLDIYANGR